MKKDNETTLEELKLCVKEFCELREWGQFHNAKDLAIGISTEANELLSLFRFKSLEEMDAMFINDEKRICIEEELVDVFYFLLRFAQLYNIDLNSAFMKKMVKNNEKYSIDFSKGNNKKYNER